MEGRSLLQCTILVTIQPNRHFITLVQKLRVVHAHYHLVLLVLAAVAETADADPVDEAGAVAAAVHKCCVR